MSKGKPYSPVVREYLLKKQKGKCFYCGDKMTMTGRNRNTDYGIDHLTPLKRGGKDVIKNLVGACNRCNIKKGVKTLAEYVRHLIIHGDGVPLSLMQRLGGRAVAQKHGPEHFRRLAKRRWRKDRAKKAAAKRGQ